MQSRGCSNYHSDVLVTSKLAAPKVKRYVCIILFSYVFLHLISVLYFSNFIPCGSAMKLNNMIYLTNRHFLSCYDIFFIPRIDVRLLYFIDPSSDIRYPSRCLWQHKISEGGRPIIAIDNKVDLFLNILVFFGTSSSLLLAPLPLHPSLLHSLSFIYYYYY